MDTQLDQYQQPTEKRERALRSLPKIGRKHIVIACAILLIAVAVVLNIVLFRGNGDTVDTPAAEPGDTVTDAADTDKTQTVSEADGYFSATQVSRQRARDEALEVLQGVVDSDEADEATKTGALLEISQLAKAMEAEANIESLVTAKGFAQCVAVINGDLCSVVVSNEGDLTPAQISQINEIVYEQAGILPTNIRIVLK